MGMPGVLPVMNRQAFDLALKAAVDLLQIVVIARRLRLASPDWNPKEQQSKACRPIHSSTPLGSGALLRHHLYHSTASAGQAEEHVGRTVRLNRQALQFSGSCGPDRGFRTFRGKQVKGSCLDRMNRKAVWFPQTRKNSCARKGCHGRRSVA